MTIDSQMIINALGSVLCLFLGYFLSDLAKKMKDMQTEATAQGKCIAEIKLLVTDKYVKKDEQEKLVTAIFKKLDTIAEKVDDMKHGTLQQITEIKLNCAANGHPAKDKP